jgi:hypothetical protein
MLLMIGSIFVNLFKIFYNHFLARRGVKKQQYHRFLAVANHNPLKDQMYPRILFLYFINNRGWLLPGSDVRKVVRE